MFRVEVLGMFPVWGDRSVVSYQVHAQRNGLVFHSCVSLNPKL